MQGNEEAGEGTAGHTLIYIYILAPLLALGTLLDPLMPFRPMCDPGQCLLPHLHYVQRPCPPSRCPPYPIGA